MNTQDIHSCLVRAGYDAELVGGASSLSVAFEVGDRRITLVHEFPDELLKTPKFGLVEGFDGKLAHVGVERNGKPREVCISDPESTTINTDCPEQVYLETVEQHVTLLTRLIEDPEYNRTEQLREFEAHWNLLCNSTDELFVVWDGFEPQGLEVRPPLQRSRALMGQTHIAIAISEQPESLCAAANWEKRQTVGKALSVSLSDLEPAPAVREKLLAWYFNAIRQMDLACRREYNRLHKKNSSNYWIVFSAPIPDGETMFAVRWHSRSEGRLPMSVAEAGP